MNFNSIPRPKGRTALDRFAQKCAFDPITGCVMWIGGQTQGHGHHEPYGSFWFEGARWLAHRWSAKHIHGFDIDNLQVDHNCLCGPSTLCIEHVKPETPEINRYLQNTRSGRLIQNLETRRFWIHTQVGILTYNPVERMVDGVPFYMPPQWLLPYMPVLEMQGYD